MYRSFFLLFMIFVLVTTALSDKSSVTFRDDGIMFVNGEPHFPNWFMRPCLDTCRGDMVCGTYSGIHERFDNDPVEDDFFNCMDSIGLSGNARLVVLVVIEQEK